MVYFPTIPSSLTRSSPAKINWVLNILGRRPDGFHNLETIIQPLPIFDQLHFRRTEGEFQFTTNHLGIPKDEKNLVVKAARAFFQRTGLKPGVTIELDKQLPVAAGLGGGSGNAAVTLQALNELFGDPLDPPEIHSLAATLGSDVPCFLCRGPCLATGRGEIIESLNPFPGLAGYWLVLVKPEFGVATAWAYQEFARRRGDAAVMEGKAQEFLIAARQRPAQAWKRLFNSLEAPVFAKFPVLSNYRDFFKSEGAEAALLSGSGSTVFAVYEKKAAAEQALEKFGQRFGPVEWTGMVSLQAESGLSPCAPEKVAGAGGDS